MSISEGNNLIVGIIGNLPKPYGGVATTCYYLTKELLDCGIQVCFYDRVADPDKSIPIGLLSYKITALRKVNTVIDIITKTIWQSIVHKQMRILIAQFFQVVVRDQQLRQVPRSVFILLLRMLEIGLFFEGKNIDILHGHHAGQESFIALMVARYYLRKPFIVTVHGSEFTMEKNRKWMHIAQMICQEADAVMCISKYTCQQIDAAGVIPQKKSVIFLGVDDEHFLTPISDTTASVRKRFDLVENHPVILFTGWMIDRKGPQILISALGLLKQLQWCAVLVGPDHGLKHSLEVQISQLQLDHRVTVSDAIPYTDLLALFSLSYVFVFPTLSKDEGFGLVALEAMAHGLPVIASNTGAIPEVIEDLKTGLLFEPGDYEGLARQLELILKSKALRNEMSAAAARRARSFTWKQSTSQLISLYNMVVEKYAGSV